MIVVNLMGGLGNQLFQYAAGRLLSQHHKTELRFVFDDRYKFAKRTPQLNFFNTEGKFLEEGEARDYFPATKLSRRIYKWLRIPFDGKMYREAMPFVMDANFFKLPKDVLLYGMWQSYQYPRSLGEILFDEITLKKPSAKFEEATSFLKNIGQTVSIHIRRADYLNPLSGFSPLPESYYKNALSVLKQLTESIRLVVFTDDKEFVNNALGWNDNVILASKFGLQDFEELMLMSRCTYHIIANSSFSWWGAYLNTSNTKMVFYPSQWHKDVTINSTLFPPTWRQLPV